MRFALLFLGLFLLFPAQHAAAGGVILMVNMNYSSEELKALEEQAAARGQRVEMVPPKSMVSLAEPLFLKRDELQEELGKHFSQESPLKLKSAIAGIMRRGSEWKDDPEIAAFVGESRMNSIYEAARRLNDTEKKNGDMFEQLRRKALELQAKGDRIDSLVLSSHSDGSNLTGETALRLSANDLYKLKQEQSAIFDSPRHVLLLGCYNLTKPNHKAWRYDLFPNASMLAGFGIRAPSRFDSKSANFIRQTMSTADRLDREMAAAGKALDPAYLEQTFKKLNTFTTQAHPGVVDYCYTIIEGLPGTWVRDCDTQWKDLYVKKDKLRDYWSLVNPQEDPPTVGGGELRNLYNTLQAACPAKETPSERDDWRASERLRVSMRETVIRLIYWWNVQSNFATYYENEIRLMEDHLASERIYRGMPKLDGSTSRVEFVAAYNSIHSRLEEKNSPLLKDFERLYSPLFFLKGEDTVAPGEKISVEETLARRAIPFNWIEGTTVMRKRT